MNGAIGIDPQIWARLSPLLDQMLELPQSDRMAWLDALRGIDGPLRELLCRLVLAPGGVETDGLLRTLPKFDVVLTHDEVASFTSTCRNGDVVGAYRLLHEIGAGGMGVVWRAERVDGLIGRPVALKLPHVGRGRSDLAERIARERGFLSTLNHPNIARLYDAGIAADGQPYLALELVDGQRIDRWCEASGLDTRERLKLFVQAARAVAHAHSQLIVHRDIKPSNLLVDAAGHVKLLDFGIAKLLDDGGGEAGASQLTEQGGRALTPDYASPEQIAGDSVTTRSDVYSLGVLLCELVAGDRPYRLKRDSRGALEDAILAVDPARPSDMVTSRTRRKALRGDVDTIVLKALKKAPDERYATVDAMADDIERHLDGRPVLARGDGAAYRAWRFVGRHRMAVGAAGAVALALVAGAGVALWQADRARLEATNAVAIKDFLVEVFRYNDPSVLDKRQRGTITAIEILDEAAKKLPAALEGQPDTKLELYIVMQMLYEAMDRNDRSMALIGAGIDLAEKRFGHDSLQRARLLVRRAQGEAWVGRFDAMDATIVEAQKIFAAQGDRTSADYGNLLSLAGHRATMKGGPALVQGRDTLLKATALLERHPTPEARNLLVGAQMYLVQAHTALDELDAASRAATRAIELSAQMNNAAQSAIAHFTRARLVEMGGDLAGARADWERSVELYRQSFGETHFQTHQARVFLGRNMHLRGERAAAWKLMNEGLAGVVQARAGSQSHAVLAHMLAQAALREGRAAQAAELAERALAVSTPLARSVTRTAPQLTLAGAWIETGQHTKARVLLDEVLTQRLATPSPVLAPLAEVHEWLGRLALAQGRPQDAQAHFGQALSPNVGRNHGYRLLAIRVGAARSRAALLAGDAPSAVSEGEQAAKSAMAADVRDHAFIVADALAAHGATLCAASQALAGRKALQAALEVMERSHDSSSPQLAATRSTLDRCAS